MSNPETPPPIPPPPVNNPFTPPPTPPTTPYSPGGWNQSPPPKGKFTWLWVLLGVVGFCIVIGVVGFFAGKNWFESESSKVIKSPPGAGHPVVTTSPTRNDGWVSVQFPEVPASLELPGEPKMEPLGPNDFETYAKLLTDQYVEYYAEGESEAVSLMVHWMTTIGRLMVEPDEIHDFSKEYVEALGFQNVTKHNMPLPSGAVAFKSSYEDNDAQNKKVTVTAYWAFIPFRKGVFIISCVPDEGDSKIAFERIAKSLTIDR